MLVLTIVAFVGIIRPCRGHTHVIATTSASIRDSIQLFTARLDVRIASLAGSSSSGQTSLLTSDELQRPDAALARHRQ